MSSPLNSARCREVQGEVPLAERRMLWPCAKAAAASGQKVSGRPLPESKALVPLITLPTKPSMKALVTGLPGSEGSWVIFRRRQAFINSGALSLYTSLMRVVSPENLCNDIATCRWSGFSGKE